MMNDENVKDMQRLQQEVTEALSIKSSERNGQDENYRAIIRKLWQYIESSYSDSHSPDAGNTDSDIRINDRFKSSLKLNDFKEALNTALLNQSAVTENNIIQLIDLLCLYVGSSCAVYQRSDEPAITSMITGRDECAVKPLLDHDNFLLNDLRRRFTNDYSVLITLKGNELPDAFTNAGFEGLDARFINSAQEQPGLLLVFYRQLSPSESINHQVFNIIARAIENEERRFESSRKLINAEEKLKVLINSTPDLILFKDGFGRWIQANNGILGLYQLEKVDYMGKTDDELMPCTLPMYYDGFRACMESDHKAWDAGTSIRIEEIVPDKNGEMQTFDVIKVPLFNDDGSRKGLVIFGRNITKGLKVSELTELLNKSALEFLELDDEANVYEFIGEKVHQLAGKCIIMVTSFHEEDQTTRLESLHGVGKFITQLLSLVGQNPIGMSAYLDPQRKQETLYQKLTTRKDLFELLAGAVNKTVCKAIERLIDIGTIYEMGFARRNDLLGDVTIILPRGKDLQHSEVIEAFIKMAAVAVNRKQVKEALVRSEESYRGLFNSITSAIYIQDKQGRFIDVNEGAVKMYGYPRERFIGSTPDFLSVAEKNASINLPEILSKAFAGIPQYIEFWGKRSNGEEFPKEVRLYKGTYFGEEVVIVIADDITERQSMINQLLEAKEATEESLNKNRGIISAFPDSIFVINRQGNLEEYISNSPHDYLEQHTTYLNRHISEAGRTDIMKLTLDNMKLVLETGGLRKYEYSVDMGGAHRYFEARMVKLDNDRVLAVVRDTTERIELIEELTRAKEKAEESDRLKTAFLHNISHEIRTPMNGIVGFSSLLTQQNSTPAEIEEFNSVIQSCSNQLLSIITDIVNIATLEAGQEKLSLSQVNINEVMQIVYHQLMAKAGEKRIALSYTTSLANEKASLITDETKLNQVLSNLISNAIKFTDKGSVSYEYQLKGDFIEFCVIDTGLGIPGEMHEEIFKRFTQVEHNHPALFGGTGLGLSITKSYVELMGGKIWLESAPGTGSKFFFTIPYKPVVHKKLPDLAESDSTKVKVSPGKNVLVVEDEMLNYKLLVRMLSSFDFNIQWVENGEEAVRVVKYNRSIDLIFMDLKLPRMNGFEATTQIKAIRPGLPVIAQSALALSGDREKALEAGCDDYISKPIRKEELISKVVKYLS